MDIPHDVPLVSQALRHRSCFARAAAAASGRQVYAVWSGSNNAPAK
ncbi:MAG: hypothetical protein ACYC2U_07245 [Candidatus Amoebophilus sp.]